MEIFESINMSFQNPSYINAKHRSFLQPKETQDSQDLRNWVSHSSVDEETAYSSSTLSSSSSKSFPCYDEYDEIKSPDDQKVEYMKTLRTLEEDAFSYTDSVYDFEERSFDEHEPPIPPLHKTGVFSVPLQPTHTVNSNSDDGYENSSKNEYLDFNSEISGSPVNEPMTHSQSYTSIDRLNSSSSHYSKDVPLLCGSLTIDCPTPIDLRGMLGPFMQKNPDEASFLRYSAITCQPEDMNNNGLQLRTWSTGRDIQIAVCLTLSDEDLASFAISLSSIMNNLKHLCSRSKSRVWGNESWEKVLVCVVIDGRNTVHQNVLDLLASIGVYQPHIAKGRVNGKRTLSHMYEFTSTINVDEKLNLTTATGDGNVPMQMLLCVKDRRLGTYNSHRWFLNGIASLARPKVCLFVRNGARLGPTSIYHAWKAFDVDSTIGGMCGKTSIDTGKFGFRLLNPFIASQHFDQMIHNNLRLPYDSCMGYISNALNAIYGFRYVALQDSYPNPGPLADYFEQDQYEIPRRGILQSNAFLAQEQLLFWKVITRKDAKWHLQYVPEACATIEAPNSMAGILESKKSEINSSFSLAVYVIVDFFSLWTTRHKFFRFLLLTVQSLVFAIEKLVNFFSMANFFLAFYFVCNATSYSSLNPYGNWARPLFLVFEYILICLIFSQFMLAMGNRPRRYECLF